MVIEDDDKVIASIEDGYFGIYTFVKPGQDIQELIDKAEHQFTNFPEYNHKYTCMKYVDYEKAQADYYMQSCRAITEEKYWEMLEVLPPIYIKKDYVVPGYNVLNAFMVSEPLTMLYYDGFIKYLTPKGKVKYATKVICRGDRSTYWTKEDLDKLEEN